MKHSPKFNTESYENLQKYKLVASSFKDWLIRLFTRPKEYIQVTEKAIIHHLDDRKSGMNSYVPYDKIDYVLLQKSGFAKKS